jgi:hypothetical protein
MKQLTYNHSLGRKARKKIRDLSTDLWGGGIFYRKRSLEVWEDHLKHNPKYAEKVFPKIIDTALTNQKITTSEAERLLDMVKSHDIENQLLAVSILKEKFKKRGNVHR